jgi:hypothetical protein
MPTLDHSCRSRELPAPHADHAYNSILSLVEPTINLHTASLAGYTVPATDDVHLSSSAFGACIVFSFSMDDAGSKLDAINGDSFLRKTKKEAINGAETLISSSRSRHTTCTKCIAYEVAAAQQYKARVPVDRETRFESRSGTSGHGSESGVTTSTRRDPAARQNRTARILTRSSMSYCRLVDGHSILSVWDAAKIAPPAQ